MIVKVTNVEELKRIFSEALLNNTDKVTKISDGSVLNGTAYGVAKLGQKSLKDLALIEAHIFPNSAVGEYLDEIAETRGISPRLGATQSCTYVRVVGLEGTTYSPNSHTFKGKGVNFIPESQSVIGSAGFAYVKVKSDSTGEYANVESLTINDVVPKPSGHEYCINEFPATGGRDLESDDDFRNRIKDEKNLLSRNTISYLEQVFRKINSEVLRVFNLGIDKVGDLRIGVSKVNGVDFTEGELSELISKGESYFSLNELKPDGESYYGIKIINIPYFHIDVSCRVDIDSSYNLDLVRKNIQQSINRVTDFRYWKNGGIIDWIDIINAVKSVKGVNRVLDNYFFPNNDIIVPKGYLPRFRGFLLMNLQGQIINNFTNTLNPIYYPNESDFAYQSSVLKSI